MYQINHNLRSRSWKNLAKSSIVPMRRFPSMLTRTPHNALAIAHAGVDVATASPIRWNVPTPITANPLKWAEAHPASQLISQPMSASTHNPYTSFYHSSGATHTTWRRTWENIQIILSISFRRKKTTTYTMWTQMPSSRQIWTHILSYNKILDQTNLARWLKICFRMDSSNQIRFNILNIPPHVIFNAF